ncbi:unnamed protein product [Urochloa decumbens]|uniref:At1g61320/AtMIF1 LRR domain-containing protein n=1 Tax=Urochloa decumbens TaxID=240449 RepID=A0ABC9EDK6_9POAL
MRDTDFDSTHVHPAAASGSPCQKDEDDNSLGGQIQGCSGSKLPKDIWCYIHSLMPMRDAAQVACVSWDFVRSWRCHPNLHFSEKTLGLKKNACQMDGQADFNSIVDTILKNHSGVGVKAFKFTVPSLYIKDYRNLDHLDSWLHTAVKPGIEELGLTLTIDGHYNFPCSLLSGRTGGLLRYLSLGGCHFHPTVRLGCLGSLTTLRLILVNIRGSELGCIFSGSFSLERLELRYCNNIVRLKIPRLQRLNYLEVVNCSGLRAIESKAPNLSSVSFAHICKVQLSLENTCRIKILNRRGGSFAFCTDLPSITPNLEALTVLSDAQMCAPIMPSNFLHLKFLSISVGGPAFDYLSLISFLDASPSLETFILGVIGELKACVSVFDDPSDLRVIPEHHHSKLKHVKVIKFSAVKSVVELTCQILESATSLECLTLDTTHGMPRCSVNETGKCFFMVKDALVEAHKGVMVAQTCIKPKVPSTVEFNVLEPCSRCHAVGL